VFILCAIAGCGGNSTTTTPQKTASLKIAATIFPLADWLKEIGGEHVEVYCLVSGAANPHHFEPTLRDTARISKMTALFSIGLELDPWAEKLVRSAGDSIELLETGTWITPRKFGSKLTIGTEAECHECKDHEPKHEHAHTHESGGVDPHYWHDPVRVKTVVARLALELARLDPAHASDYQTRATAYQLRLEGLNQTVADAAKSIPKNSRLVVFHDAYGYLFERLNIALAAVIQTTPGIEPSLKNISEAVRVLKDIKQTVVFKEPQDNALAVERVAQEVGARVDILDPMDSVVGVQNADKNGYIERFNENLLRLKKALP
jgi:zinc transport system substrate-binding protein